MLPDRVSNPGPLTYESGALPIALRGPAAMKAIKFQINVLLQLYVKNMARTVLFPNEFPVNTLMDICTNY